MDPISIASACVGAVGTISKLSVQVAAFVSDVRDARKDMEAVSRELTSLTICLASLRDDSEKVNFPETLLDVVHNCDTIAKDMADILTRLSTAKTARLRWTMGDRDQINKLRASLESHKSCIDVALDMASFQLLSAVKEDTTDIRAETSAIKKETAEIPSIKQDTVQIASLIQEIGYLRLQVSDLRREDSRGGFLLQRFLDESSTYAESAVDAAEFQSAQVDEQIPLEDIGEDEDFCSSTPSSTVASPPVQSDVVSNTTSISNNAQLPAKAPQIPEIHAASLHTRSNVMIDNTTDNQREDEVRGADAGLSSLLSTSLSTKSPPPIPKRKPLALSQNISLITGTESKPEVSLDNLTEFDPLETQLSFMTKLAQTKFVGIWKAAAGGREVLGGVEAKDLLARSRLPSPILSQIWTLSDTRKTGELTFPEFALAMGLSYLCVNGKSPPAVLPTHVQTEISYIIDRIHQSRATTTLPGEMERKNGSRPTLERNRSEETSFGAASGRFTSHSSDSVGLFSPSELSERADFDVSLSQDLAQVDSSNFAQTQSGDEAPSWRAGKAPRPKPNPFKVRRWMDRSGSFTVEAQFIGVANGKIHLHKANGVKIAVPQSKMSDDDLAYIDRVQNV